MDDTEVDPAMLEAMGFSAFGGKPGKRRKVASDEAFVDAPARGTGAEGTAQVSEGANTSTEGARIGTVPEGQQIGGSQLSASKQMATRPHFQPVAQPPHAAPSTWASNVKGNDEDSLLALKNGVRNQYGDMVYFLPSFVEDPWKDLKK